MHREKSIEKILSKFKEQLIHREFLKVAASNYSNLLSLEISFSKSKWLNSQLGSLMNRWCAFRLSLIPTGRGLLYDRYEKKRYKSKRCTKEVKYNNSNKRQQKAPKTIFTIIEIQQRICHKNQDHLEKLKKLPIRWVYFNFANIYIYYHYYLLY